MATTVWGLLAKSLTDNEKIEAAIARLIQAHDDDPDAHLDTGQALKSHRAAEIIDHLANSIVEDKIATGEISSRNITTNQIVGKDIRTASDVGAGVDGVKMTPSGIEMWQSGERKVNIPVSGSPEFLGTVRAGVLDIRSFFVRTFFESLDGWYIYQTGGRGTIAQAVGNLGLTCGNQVGDEIGVSWTDMPFSIDYSGQNIGIEGQLLIDDVVQPDFVVSVGVDVDLADSNGFGFRYDATAEKLYAFHKKAGTEYKTEVSVASFSVLNRYRAEFRDNAIWFFINGVSVAIHTTNLPVAVDDFKVFLKFKAIDTDEPQAQVCSLTYYQPSA